MRGINPDLAKIHYKDKNIDIEIPIKMRMFYIDRFKCPKCGVVAGMKEIKNFIQKNKIDMQGHPSACPLCLSRKNGVYKLKNLKQRLFEAYVPTISNYFVDLTKLLRFITYIRFKHKYTMFVPYYKVSCVSSDLNYFTKNVKCKFGKDLKSKVKYKVYKVKISDLEKAYEITERMRIEKAI